MWISGEWIRVIAILSLDTLIAVALWGLIFDQTRRLIIEGVISVIALLALHYVWDWSWDYATLLLIAAITVIPRLLSLLRFMATAPVWQSFSFLSVSCLVAVVVIWFSRSLMGSPLGLAVAEGIALMILAPAAFVALGNRFWNLRYPYPYEKILDIDGAKKNIVASIVETRQILEYFQNCGDFSLEKCRHGLKLYGIRDDGKLWRKLENDFLYASDAGRENLRAHFIKVVTDDLAASERDLAELETLEQRRSTWKGSK